MTGKKQWGIVVEPAPRALRPRITVARLQSLVARAMEQFIERDKYLLEFDVNERTVSHRLAIYVEAGSPDGWNVDCEYNRNLSKVKGLHPPPDPIAWGDTKAKTVYPDIIVHKRGKPDNLLVIEMKKFSSGEAADFDRDKLRAYTNLGYNYTLGAFIPFTTGSDGKFGTVEWFVRGRPLRGASGSIDEA